MRKEEGYSDIVANLQRDLQEIKTRQFTSQDSGMQFASIEPSTTSATVPAVAQGEFKTYFVQVKTSVFSNYEKPILALPTIDVVISGGGETIERTITGIGTFDASKAESFSASFAVNAFFHVEETSNKNETRWVSTILCGGFFPELSVDITFRPKASSKGYSKSSSTVVEFA